MSSLGSDAINQAHALTDPYSAAHVYYADPSHRARQNGRARTYSTGPLDLSQAAGGRRLSFVPKRRTSHDSTTLESKKRFLVPVDATLKALLEQEDIDNNHQITIDDQGPKVITLKTAESNGFKRVELRGTYQLSNLLQELTIAKSFNRKQIVLDQDRLNENPVARLSRLISDTFWDGLTRRIDGENIAQVGKDPKDRSPEEHKRPRIYVPVGAPQQYEYYTTIAKKYPELKLDVQMLPVDITPEYVRSLNGKPGLLAIAMEQHKNPVTGEVGLRGLPFIVPGGRFNELYGWDSYMESLGLMINGRTDLARSMVIHFCFCIKHYGKILNANRSYYLMRSQPPFLTDMALRVFNQTQHEPGAREFLRNAILAAIKEYHSVWVTEPRLDPTTGLSRYRPEGKGIPPETEASHFEHILEPYQKKHNMTFDQFCYAYNHDEVSEPELDEYFMHDRGVRESGHDTSYRLEKICGNLATVDLNSLLYKYEVDIARTIHHEFNDRLSVPAEFCVGAMKPGEVQTSATWDRRARKRKAAMDKYMWSAKDGMYFDYNTALKQRTNYESATTFWAMWAGVASPDQASQLVKKALPKFEEMGGLASGTERSRGQVGLDRPNRQWDYPFGWAPQQMLAWTGLQRYGYREEAERLAYKWLYMVTRAFVDFNGVVVEKYDVTRERDPHKVEAEYGNQGADFKGVVKEG